MEKLEKLLNESAELFDKIKNRKQLKDFHTSNEAGKAYMRNTDKKQYEKDIMKMQNNKGDKKCQY